MTFEEQLVLLWMGQCATPADGLSVQRVRRSIRARLRAGVPAADIAGDLVIEAWGGHAPDAMGDGRLDDDAHVVPFRLRIVA